MQDVTIDPQETITPQPINEDSRFTKLFKWRLGRANYLYGILWISLGIPLILFPIFLLSFIESFKNVMFIFQILYIPVSIFYSLSLIIRRLHDLNKNGWLSLIMMVPIANLIFGLFLLFKKGDEATNKYGLPPKLGIDKRLVFGIKPKINATP